MSKKNNKHIYTKEKKLSVRIIMIILAVLLIVGIVAIPIKSLAISAFAEENTDIVIENFETGKLSDAVNDAANGTDFNNITRIAVSGGTLSAADYEVFLNIPNLEYIELAGAETENGIIPDNALPSRNCLAYISLPKNTAEIGANAFSGNRKLEKISMPESVSVIGDYAFDACENLASVPITANVTYIGEGAFRDCKAITEFTIPASITEIYPYTFSKCGFSEIIIGPSVSSIGDGAFSDCYNLTDIYSYSEEAPSLSGSGVFQNVSASVHVYGESEKSYSFWEGNNIKVTGDLSGEYPVETAAAASAETEDITEEMEISESETENTEITSAKTETGSETTAKKENDSSNNSGIGIATVIIIVIMAVIIAVLATILVMTKRSNK